MAGEVNSEGVSSLGEPTAVGKRESVSDKRKETQKDMEEKRLEKKD